MLRMYVSKIVWNSKMILNEVFDRMKQVYCRRRDSYRKKFLIFSFFAMILSLFYIFLFFSTIFFYKFYTPLPKNLTDRRILLIFEALYRFFYYYPIKLANFCHFYNFHVKYSRLFYKLATWLPNKIYAYGKKCKVYTEIFDTVQCKVYVPLGIDDVSNQHAAIFYIHGGGYVLFDVDSFDNVTRRLCLQCGVVVVSVNYRLAPENEFLTSLKDCERSLTFFLKNARDLYGVDPDKVLIMGDSAGGGIAAVLARKFKNLKAQILVYPWTQAVDFLTPSYKVAHQLTRGTSLLDPEMMAVWTLMYTNGDTSSWKALMNNEHHRLAKCQRLLAEYNWPKNDENVPQISNFDDTFVEKLFHEDFSPLFSKKGHLIGCPRTLIFTCEFDVLKNDGILYKNRLVEEKVKVEHVHYDRGFHGMLNFCNQLNLADQMMNKVVGFVDKIF